MMRKLGWENIKNSAGKGGFIKNHLFAITVTIADLWEFDSSIRDIAIRTIFTAILMTLAAEARARMVICENSKVVNLWTA
jgi:hypothetical protein